MTNKRSGDIIYFGQYREEGICEMYMGPRDGSALMRSSNFHDSTLPCDSALHGGRTILHCDANSFFASCETMLHPEYASVPMAVCGSVEDRHGIVLAKNELAKKYNVKTAETVWSAKKKCPELLIVRPTYGLYGEVSERMNRIFYDYTDLVEPFGVDESWLDVTGSKKLFGSGREIADSIRERIKREIGITVSIGVSFNKIFAKLGSDLKKPDATSEIPYDMFSSIVWPLPVSALLFVGRSTEEKLLGIGIKTIGDLACCEESVIRRALGKNGVMLREFACGRDYAEVTVSGYEPEPKSVSNGMTFRYNLSSREDISFAVTYLSMSVAERLRKHGLCCNNVSVSIRTPNMETVSRSVMLEHPSCLYSEISKIAFRLVCANCDPTKEIYSVTVHAEKLTRENGSAFQQKMFPEPYEKRYQKLYALENAVDSIRSRYGKKSIGIASSLNNRLI